MIASKLTVMLALLALAGGPAAQGQVDERRIAELIQRVTLVEDEAERWFWNTPTDLLVRAGSPVVPELLRLLQRRLDDGDVTETEAILRVLEAMGPDAIEAWPLLRELMGTIPPEHLPSLLRTLSELGPYNFDFTYLEANNLELFAVTRSFIGRDMRAVLQFYFRRWLERGSFHKMIINANDNTAKLLEALEHGRMFEPGLAAELLARREVDADIGLPVMQRVMVANKESWFRIGSQGSVGGDDRLSPPRPEMHLLMKLTQAMLSISSSDPRTAMAHGFVLDRHADPSRREMSAIAIGSFGSEGEEAIPFLLKALEDDGPRVVQTCITALGMIGPAAKDAIPTLEKLSEHADPQLAERAKAALRQVRGR